MNKKYKMLVLDLDGTLTNKDKIITPKTKEAIMKAQENGVIIVLASGRPTYGIMPLANELKLADYGGYILAYNGGNIIRVRDMEVVFKKEIDKSLYKEIFELKNKYNVDILSYEGEDIITNNIENEFAIIEQKINKMPIRQVEDFENYIKWNVPKFIMLEEGEYLAGVEGKVKAALGKRLEVYRSEAFFLEILPRGIDKAESLGRLLEMLDMDKSQVIACGDGYNDLTMIEYAGLGVAMENAVLPVRNSADYITLSNNDDGIAKVVYEFLI